LGRVPGRVFLVVDNDFSKTDIIVKAAALFLIRLYQLTLSPLLGSRCRYHPTCSAYTHEAIVKYGVFRGAFLGIKRLFRCHPFHEGGIDLVP
jgi:putative membrane protein insertion efficiency factor